MSVCVQSTEQWVSGLLCSSCREQSKKLPWDASRRLGSMLDEVGGAHAHNYGDFLILVTVTVSITMECCVLVVRRGDSERGRRFSMTSVTSGYQTEGSPSDLSVSLGGRRENREDGREQMGVRIRVGREQKERKWRRGGGKGGKGG